MSQQQTQRQVQLQQQTQYTQQGQDELVLYEEKGLAWIQKRNPGLPSDIIMKVIQVPSPDFYEKVFNKNDEKRATTRELTAFYLINLTGQCTFKDYKHILDAYDEFTEYLEAHGFCVRA